MNLGSVLLRSFRILSTALPRKDVRKDVDKERKKKGKHETYSLKKSLYTDVFIQVKLCCSGSHTYNFMKNRMAWKASPRTSDNTSL